MATLFSQKSPMKYYVRIEDSKVVYKTKSESWSAYLERDVHEEGLGHVSAKISGFDCNPYVVCITQEPEGIVATVYLWEEDYKKRGVQIFNDQASAYNFAVRFTESLNDMYDEELQED